MTMTPISSLIQGFDRPSIPNIAKIIDFSPDCKSCFNVTTSLISSTKFSIRYYKLVEADRIGKKFT